MTKINPFQVAACALTLLASVASLHAKVTPIVSISSQNGGEIQAYDKFNKMLFGVTATGVEFYSITNPALPVLLGTNDLSQIFSPSNTVAAGGVSSVAADPQSRGFGVATVIPATNDLSPGKIVFFELATRTVITNFDLGWHPDMAVFTPDGTKILIANEGELDTIAPIGTVDRPGSISVVNLAGVTNIATLSLLAQSNVATVDFTGVDLSGVRVHPVNDLNRVADMEPEYISVNGNKAYVTLQENNAVAVFNLSSNAWESIASLGAINQTIDASDRDANPANNNPTNRIDDVVTGLQMPDAIATFTVGADVYYVVANEGDSRDAHATLRPATDEMTGIAAPLEITYSNALNTTYSNLIGQAARHQSALGRLRFSKFDGTNSSGLITNLFMFGTRSFCIHKADGTRVFDSGSDFETITSQRLGNLYNSELGLVAEFDKRSDNKGPEPEGVTVGTVGGRTYAFISLERCGGVMQYDITTTNAYFVDYVNTTTNGNDTAPEGMLFIPAADSPNGNPLLIVGYEGDNRIGIFDVTTTAPVISSQPQTRTLPAGSPVTFTADASGIGALTYQWYSNGVLIAGATNSTYTTSLPGSYTVRVSSPADGATVSSVGALSANNSAVAVSGQFSGFVNHGLVGMGRLSGDLLDTVQGAGLVDTLGGLFSSMYFDIGTWQKVGIGSNATYKGVLYGLPDRGFGDGANPYKTRLQELAIAITPVFGAGTNLPQNQIEITHQGAMLLRHDVSGTLKNLIGSDADDAAQTNYPGTTFGGGNRSFDPEGLVVTTDGRIYISDEYGPFVYRFSSNGVLEATLDLPAAVIPKDAGGTNDFDSVTTKTSGRSNNRGMEGLAISPDQTRLFSTLQSPTVQDGGNNARNIRVFVFDIVPGSPTENQPVAEYIFTRPLGSPTAIASGNASAVSEITALNDHQLLVIDRDGRGLGSGNAAAPYYKSITVIDLNGATNILGSAFDLAKNTVGQTNLSATTDLSTNGIKSVASMEFVDLISAANLGKFGINKLPHTTGNSNTLSEKWEALAIVPMDQTDFPNQYLLLVGNDNDLSAASVYHNGQLLATNPPPRNDNILLAYHVTLPGYVGVTNVPVTPGNAILQITPELKHTSAGGVLNLDWPATVAGYQLVESTNVTGPYAPSSEPITTNGFRLNAAPTMGDGNRFYQLKK